jgi:methionyl-tRNA formyltransferase
MRVVFMGTPEFAVPTLSAIAGAGHEVVLVVAQPDAPAGRGHALRAPPVAELAKALGLPLAQPRAIKSGSFPERLDGLGADVAVVLAYGRILPRRVLDAPRHGCVNVHASLLPRWRGAAPIQAAILAGDTETGVATQRMEEGLDTGPIYVARKLDIDPSETAGTLHDRLAALSARVAVETLDDLPSRVPTPQPDVGITWAPKIGRDDGRLDWSEPAAALDRRVRAMTPWPGGWFESAAQGVVKVLAARPVEGGGPPGTVIATRPLTVACAEGALVLDRVQTAGKRPVGGDEYANGARLRIGDRP